MGNIKELKAVVVPRKTIRRFLDRVVVALDRVGKSKTPGVRTVHRLRVACRRAQAGLKLFQTWLPRKRRKKLHESLNHIRKAADLTRGMDILLEHLVDSPKKTPRQAWFLAARKDRIQSANKLFLAVLNKRESFRRRSKALVERVKRDSGERIARKTRERLQNLIVKMNDSMVIAGRDGESYHAFRIALKKVRYAMEISRSLWPAVDVGSIVGMLKTIQDRFGAANDQLEFVADLHERKKNDPNGPWQELLEKENKRRDEAWQAVVPWLESIRGSLRRKISIFQDAF